MDLAPHVKDLITAYQAMPITPRRERIIAMLKETYVLATSDGLESVLSTNTTQNASPIQTPVKTAVRAKRMEGTKVLK